MPKFNITHKSNLKTQDSYAKIKAFFNSEEEMKKIGQKMQCSFDDKTLTGKAKGGQFSAEIVVKSDGEGSKIEILVDLAMLLTPLKGKVQEIITHKLAKFIG